MLVAKCCGSEKVSKVCEEKLVSCTCWAQWNKSKAFEMRIFWSFILSGGLSTISFRWLSRECKWLPAKGRDREKNVRQVHVLNSSKIWDNIQLLWRVVIARSLVHKETSEIQKLTSTRRPNKQRNWRRHRWRFCRSVEPWWCNSPSDLGYRLH